MRLRDGVRRAAAAGLLAAGLFAAGPAAGAGLPAATAAALGGTYTAATMAAGVQVTSVQETPFTPFSDRVVLDTVGYATAGLGSGQQSSAQAAAFYPGDLVAQGGPLLCDTLFGNLPGGPGRCPAQLPRYPLAADAIYPTRQRDSADVSGPTVGGAVAPLTVRPAQASATADVAANTATAAAEGVSALAGTPAALSVGAVRVSSQTSAASAGLRVRLRAELADVRIGPLVVRSLVASDDVLVPPTGRPRDTPKVTLAGVSVAGQDASIDGDGVHVGGQDGPAPPALARQGLTVRLVGTDRQDRAGSARSTASGLEVTAVVPVAGVPPLPAGPNPNNGYTVRLVLAAVGTAAATQADETFSFPTFPGALRGRPGSPPGRLPAVPATAPVTGTVSVPGPATGAPPPPAAGGDAPVVAGPAGGGGFALLSVDLSLVSAVLALGTMAAFLGWRAFALLATVRRRG